MKKYLYTLLFMAVALFSASALVSCGDDEDDPKPEPLPVSQNYAKYTAKLSEDIFAYFDVAVTIEVDGKKDVYTFGENTKVADMNLKELQVEPMQKAGRVLEIPVFKFGTHPLKITTDIQLSEAGKQKVAKATTEEMDFVISLDYGQCNEKGEFVVNNAHVSEYRAYGGNHVKDLETFLETFHKNFQDVLDKTFK